jgi:glycosyltransferase involved in cell wall biosynthesis
VPGVLILIKGLGRGGAEQLLLSGVPYLDTATYRYQFAYLLPWKDSLVPELTGAGFGVHCLDGARGPGWTGRLRRLVRAEGIRLVHVHSPVAAAGARAVAGRRTRVVYTEHNLWDRYHPATWAANLVTFPRNDHVFAVSETVRQSIRYPGPLRRLLPMPPLETLHHGLDPAALPPVHRGATASLLEPPGPPPGTDGVRAELGIPEDAPVVGSVANFKAAKDHATLLRAAAQVRQAVPSVRFVLVGQGPLEAETRRLAGELGLDGTVVFAGFRTDATRLMAAFDAFALSSTYEGLPIALIEAMATGCPAVATRVGGTPEVVADGVHGYLVPPRDPAALAAGLTRLLEDRALRDGLGAAAAARAQDFDIRKAVRRMEQVYARLLA